MHNAIAITFRELVSAFSHDAASNRVDVLAADFAAQVAAPTYEPCLGLFRPELLARYWGVIYLLDLSGVELRRKPRPAGDGVFLYARVSAPRPSEFSGAVVVERRAAARAVA